MSLTRRQALGAAALAAAGCGYAPARPRRQRRLVVVGAGLAGLAAATDAWAAGWDVIVLEREPRVGGRVLTLRLGGEVAEGGGEFIDASHTEMRRYAQRFGLPLQDVYRTGPDLPGCAYLDGRRRADRGHDGAEDRFYAALDRQPGSDALDRSSVADLLDRLRPGPEARAYLEHSLLDDYTVAPRELSLLFAVRSEWVAVRGPERYRVREGNDRIPEALADALGTRVHRDAAVDSVAWSDRGAEVRAAGERFAADACVLATPLPALRDVAMTPKLPARLAAAVQQVQYGRVVKVALRYPDRPWRAQGFNGDTRTDLPIGTTWEATSSRVLLVYAAGAAEVPDAAGDVARIYPGAVASEARTVTWPASYAAFAPGQVVPFAGVLRRPAGRLLLAGEHVSRIAGYMEGAVRSGRRAARLLEAWR